MARLGALNTGTDISTTGGGGGGATQALMETRTAAAAATIDVAVKSLRTAGYSAVGDGGHGLYARLNALPSHAAYFRSADRFLADGTTNSTNGGYWGLVAEGGEIRIEQFGGKGNTLSHYDGGTLGTDNYQPMVDALAYSAYTITAGTPDTVYANTIRFGVGIYYFSQYINVYSTVRIAGHGGFVNGEGPATATAWRFPANSHGIIFHASNTSDVTGATPTGTATSSVFEGITLDFYGSTADLTKVAVHVRTQMLLQRISVSRAPGKGFYIHATAASGGAEEGNANNWAIRDCSVYSGFFHALHVAGNDANGGSCAGFVTGPGDVYGCGILDASGAGSNVYSGLQISGYGGMAPGNRGVHLAGRRYLYIAILQDQGTVTPGTNSQVWMDIGAGVADVNYPEWVSSSTAHFARMPILSYPGGSTRNLFLCPYVEGSGFVHVPPPSIVIGGQNGSSRSENPSASLFADSNIRGLISTVGFGSYNTWDAASTSFPDAGAAVSAWLGVQSVDEPQRGIAIWAHKRAIDPQPFEYRYEFKDIKYGQQNAKAVLRVTTSQTTQTFGRNAAQPNHLLVEDLALGDSTNGNNHRVVGYRDAAPTTGYHARGEFFFNVAPAAGGTFGWSCIASGTPGTWKAIPVPA